MSAVILVFALASNINFSPSKSKAHPSRVNKFDPWVRVTSPLLKLITAPDEPNNKSSPIVKSVLISTPDDASISTVGAVISYSESASISN